MSVVCIDPGKRTGWALIVDGAIVSSGTIARESLSSLPQADAALIEMPRVYVDQTKWKGDPQNIVLLAAVAGECAARYPFAVYVEPREWRGMVPEPVLLQRIERSLRNGEKLGASVHARDAQGMALWLMRRLR